MGDLITHENDGTVKIHAWDKLSDTFHGVANFFQDTNDKMKTDPFAAELVGGAAGVVASALSFWALKKMLFEKIGMDGMGGDVLSLVGAVVIGLAMFNLVANKDADSRAAHMRQQWADTHPPRNGGPFDPAKDSLRGEMNRSSGATKDTGPTTQRPAAPSNISVTVNGQEEEAALPGTRSEDPDLVAQAPVSRPGMGGPGFG